MSTVGRVGPVVLIGPVCAGKTTLLPLVARRLGRSAVDLDAVAEPYYAEAGRARADFLARIQADSPAGAYAWWQEGHPHAVRRVLDDHDGSVIAFGAGHTSFEATALAEEVRAALQNADAFVVLVLPCAEPSRSVVVLRARSLATRGRDWIEDGIDFIDRWVRDPTTRAMATVTVFTEGRTLDETADEIARAAAEAQAAEAGSRTPKQVPPPSDSASRS